MKNEVDLSELQKQREEFIKNNGQYCELRIIVGLNERIPYAHFESRKVTSVEHALMMKCLDEVKIGLFERDPLSEELYKKMRIETTHIDQKIGGKEENE